MARFFRSIKKKAGRLSKKMDQYQELPRYRLPLVAPSAR